MKKKQTKITIPTTTTIITTIITVTKITTTTIMAMVMKIVTTDVCAESITSMLPKTLMMTNPNSISILLLTLKQLIFLIILVYLVIFSN